MKKHKESKKEPNRNHKITHKSRIRLHTKISTKHKNLKYALEIKSETTLNIQKTHNTLKYIEVVYMKLTQKHKQNTRF